MEKTYTIVFVTTPSKKEAENIVQTLVDAKVIACANIIGPVSSIFRWSGKIEKAEEYLIVMKTRNDLFERVEAAVKAVHSYDVPEILALPIVGGSKDYLEWLETCLL